VGFVVDKMALGQVFSEYFGFPCQSSFHQLLHNHPHLSSRVYNRPVPGDVSPTPQKKKLVVDRASLNRRSDEMYKVETTESLNDIQLSLLFASCCV
jgi:hypothetical protein